ncbi:phosphotransferase enzyme family protein [Acidovorax sp. FJL06]|uniref:phosphotransferase enzyme family protein n=1 Tax=Acidovorax sp. FJL06 TaxID=2153365 RepID=UPI000F56FBEB|nr:phosphotransferase [Acidovorax sp. FJL06]RQO80948.1 kinase [Acidovorax sp. FJL06]
MTIQPAIDPGLIHAHTTAAPSSVIHWMKQHYGLNVQRCHLIRRGLNDNYALLGSDGTRYVARLYSIRPRGEFNIDFETSLLEHLAARQIGVAAPLRSVDGSSHARLQFPEGLRALAVFCHADGVAPETLDEFELTGRTLALIHVASRDYAGPASRYTLNGHHLVGRTWKYLQDYPELEIELLDAYQQRIQALQEELSSLESDLTKVICHGDTHGFNNHVYANTAGDKKAVFFDFDDAGPGYLAYDMSVMPWSYLARKMLKEPDDVLQDRWKHYLHGYRAGGGEISEADLVSLPMFLQLRHLWNLGEAVGRLNHWGTSMAPADWLHKQIDRMEPWKKLDLRA